MCGTTRTRRIGFTLMELLVVVSIILLLGTIMIPLARSSRARARLATCGAYLRSLGQALHAYANEGSDVLPHNIHPWTEADSRTWALTTGTGGGSSFIPGGLGWIGRVGRYLYDAPPWLADLRCPASVTTDDLEFHEPREGEGAACWMLNAYCSGRKLGSIPNAADGVMVLEIGVWSASSYDTGSLEAPETFWVYPHPDVLVEGGQRWFSWLGSGSSQERNLLWCDGHVQTVAAKTWPLGDQPFDQSRIRHMRFGLPGTNDRDPF